MVSSQVYQVILPLSQLPPRDIRVVDIATDPTTVDFVYQHKELCFDLEINNTSGTACSVVINDQIAYLLNGGNAKNHSDVLIQKVTIGNITSGYLICHVIALRALEKIGALDTK